ncbi:unnamed protein product [Bursaphelenchus xylophilus]|uniref:UDP-N-acetylglucosamine transferase subunit ALG14 n=1 Tax=Bursaphelenchus xylophilus TaxID=6326 RepID=A0A1I7RKP5_BURXY|nr:unnamed protein product [Bursaphelenchus xylophilus]CAG9131180.1 unnamed protein product [Bursaphelenchus xylophilus]
MDVLTGLLAIIVGLFTFFVLLFLVLLALYVLHMSRRAPKRPKKLLAVMGSGGHTMEMISLLRLFTEEKEFPKRSYLYYDEASRKKIADFEKEQKNDNYEIFEVPRSREVGQSYFTSVFSTIKSILVIPALISGLNPDLLLCNGPGTCVPVAVITFMFNLLNIYDCRIVYVESICRVHTMSLTGLILYHLRLCDAFYVQWPQLQKKYPRSIYECKLV